MSEIKVDHLVDGVNPSGSTNLTFNPLPPALGLSLVNQYTVRKIYKLRKSIFNKLSLVINNIMAKKPYQVAKVYRFQAIDVCNRFNSVSYFYDMQRLYPLTPQEYAIVNSCSDNLNTKWENDCPLIKLGKEKYPELINFFNYVEKELKYKDLHAGNVMKDKSGNFKLIDLEGFI